jgi:SHS2 domain-containing protein
MLKYKFIEGLTSDVMFEAYGKDLKELYANAAEALFSVICQIKKVKPIKKEEFLMKGDKLSDTMWNWLAGLIAIVDTEHMFFSKFEIVEADEFHVKARLYGEEAKPETGETVVKSVTNYKYKVEKTSDGYKAVVSLDI